MKKTVTQVKQIVLAFSAFFMLLAASPAFGQVVLASWNPSGLGGYGPSPWAPTASSASITVGGWTRGSGVGTGGTAAGSGWGGVGVTGGMNEDFTFTITSNPGSIVSYSVFNMDYRRSNTGATGGDFSYTIGNASTTYTLISPMSFAAGNGGNTHAPINLSGVAGLQNVAPGTVIKFRILPTGGASTGTWYIYNSGASISGSFSSFSALIAQTASISCNGQANGALTASVSGGTGPFTYSWSTAATPSISPANATASVVSNLAAGVYSCLVTGANAQTTMATYTLAQPAVLTASVVTLNNVSCNGGANGSATIAPVGGTPSYSFMWTPMGGTGTTPSGLTAGVYTLAITDSHSCTATQTIAIAQPAATLVPVSSSSYICNGSAVTFSTNGTGTYTWTGGVITGTPFSPSVTATYTVSSANPVGGCTESATIIVGVYPTPTVMATASSSAICIGSSVSVNATGADSYVWEDGLTGGTAFTPTSTASYTVTGTDVNACTNTAVVSVTVNALPTLSVSTDKATICKSKTATLTVTGATTYSWSTNATTSLVTVSPTITTTYSLTGTDANGCSSTASITQSVSACLGIETINGTEIADVIVFPNPSNGAVSIKYASDITLTVINELSQAVLTVELNSSNNHEAKIENLNSGIYFIMSATSGYTVNKKVIVTN